MKRFTIGSGAVALMGMLGVGAAVGQVVNGSFEMNGGSTEGWEGDATLDGAMLPLALQPPPDGSHYASLEGSGWNNPTKEINQTISGLTPGAVARVWVVDAAGSWNISITTQIEVSGITTEVRSVPNDANGGYEWQPTYVDVQIPATGEVHIRFAVIPEAGFTSGYGYYIDDIQVEVIYHRSDWDHDGDVDQSDFGLFQACISGPAVPLQPGCEAQDLDGDDDVDLTDFGLFQRCLTGSSGIPDFDCTQ